MPTPRQQNSDSSHDQPELRDFIRVDALHGGAILAIGDWLAGRDCSRWTE